MRKAFGKWMKRGPVWCGIMNLHLVLTTFSRKWYLYFSKLKASVTELQVPRKHGTMCDNSRDGHVGPGAKLVWAGSGCPFLVFSVHTEHEAYKDSVDLTAVPETSRVGLYEGVSWFLLNLCLDLDCMWYYLWGGMWRLPWRYWDQEEERAGVRWMSLIFPSTLSP